MHEKWPDVCVILGLIFVQQKTIFWWFFVKNLNITWDILQKMKFWNRVWFTCFSWKYLENAAFACTAAQNALFDFPKNMTWRVRKMFKLRSRVGESLISAILCLCKNGCLFCSVFSELAFSHHKTHFFLDDGPKTDSGSDLWRPLPVTGALQDPPGSKMGPKIDLKSS